MRTIELYTYMFLLVLLFNKCCVCIKLSIFSCRFLYFVFVTPCLNFIKCISMFWTNKGIIIIKEKPKILFLAFALECLKVNHSQL